MNKAETRFLEETRFLAVVWGKTRRGEGDLLTTVSRALDYKRPPTSLTNPFVRFRLVQLPSPPQRGDMFKSVIALTDQAPEG